MKLSGSGSGPNSWARAYMGVRGPEGFYTNLANKNKRKKSVNKEEKPAKKEKKGHDSETYN